MVCYRLLISLGNSKLNEIKYNKYGYYCEFPNGLLIQWGRGKCYEYQRYPIPFTTAVSPVVCPNNGWINIYRGIYNYGMRLYINNILVSTAWLYWDCAYNRDEQNYNIVPVSKDDVITFSGGNNGVYFTPCK